MKILIYPVIFCLILISCNQEINHKTDKLELGSTTLKIPIQNENNKREETEKNNMKSGNYDFLSLNAGIDSAKEYLSFENFKKEFYYLIPGSEKGIYVSLTIERIFSKNQKHLILKRGFADWTHFYIYKIKNEELIPVLKHLQDGHSFIKDTIFDVNGDGTIDFSVHSYSSAGCCRRNFFTVFLAKQNGDFESEKEFMNPTFFPDEKLVRGVQYGYGSGLYKCKWRGFEIDTIEYIMPYNPEEYAGKYYRISHKEFKKKNSEKVRLNAIPKEYENINDIDWLGV